MLEAARIIICWHFCWHSRVEKFQVLAAHRVRIGGKGRNRTMSSPAASPNTLIYRGILTLILQGFKWFLALHARAPDLARHVHLDRLLKNSLKVFNQIRMAFCTVSV
jgi:hypothetical protein